ncbi:MAG: EAL domain-containing protein [Mycobacteriales bacterium]|nr:EAL domain-containing protein [Mycobacteriales bacterium]
MSVLLSGVDAATVTAVRHAVAALPGGGSRVVEEALLLSVPDLDVLLERLSLLVNHERATHVRAVVLPPGPIGTSAVVRAMSAGSLADLLDEQGGALAAVMERGRWSAAYQPVVSLVDGAVHGHEALLRVRLDGRLLDTGALFGGAGSVALHDELDARAVVAAISGAADGLGEGRLFVNTSASNADALRRLLTLLERTALYAGVPLSRVVLEVTERRPLSDEQRFAEVLAEARSRGLQVALDDLGEGYSSLQWFASLTPDYIKIDGGLVRRLPSVGATAVIRGLVEVAHRAGALVVAEHVESDRQRDALRALGVDLGQGHALGRPGEL